MSLNDVDATRVEWIKAQARRVAETGEQDRRALQILHSWLAQELVERDRHDLIGLAMRALQAEPAQATLAGLLKDCGEAFRLEDRVIAAVVVPVAVRMTQEFGAAVSVRHGRASSTKALARVVRLASAATHVVFDSRLYRGADLIGVKPRAMRDHLLALEREASGQVELCGSGARLRTDQLPQWEVVYFLGVAVYEPHAELTLNDPGVITKTRAFGKVAEEALDQAEPVAWTQGVEVETRCLGYYYLNHGIEVGESARRGFELDGVLATIDQGLGILDFYYAEDEKRDCIRLLVSSNLQHLQFVWPRFGEFGTELFRRTLDQAIANRVADPRDIVKVSLTEYRERAAEKGVIWS